MNQELKNFDMLIVELEKAFENGDYGAGKTIVNIYGDLLPKLINKYLLENYRLDNNLLFSKHNDMMNKLIVEIINATMPKLIGCGDFKSLHSVQYVQDKLQSFVNNINIVLKQFEINLYPSYDINNILDISIKNKVLITQVGEDLRNTGKTIALIKKAYETGATLIVGRHMTKRVVDEESRKLGYKIDCQYISDQANIRGRRFKNKKFLVDDSTSNVAIRELIKQGNEFLGGFNSLNDSLSMLKQPTLLEHLHTKLNKLINERDVINATYLDDAPLMKQWVSLSRKIEVINEMIHDEKLENTKRESENFKETVVARLNDLDIPWE